MKTGTGTAEVCCTNAIQEVEERTLGTGNSREEIDMLVKENTKA